MTPRSASFTLPFSKKTAKPPKVMVYDEIQKAVDFSESLPLFLVHAKDGTLKGAEMDAIALRQLMINREKLEKLRQN